MYKPPNATETYQIPHGLMAEPCDSTASYLISQSFYSQYLSHRELFPINRALDIEGAAGQKVSYVGYVEMEVQFPKDACGEDKCFHILALVSPDLAQLYNEKFPLQFCTNVLCPMIQDFKQSWNKTEGWNKISVDFLQSIQTDWAMQNLAKSLNSKQKMPKFCVCGKIPLCLTQGEMCILKGICHTTPRGEKFQACMGGLFR